MRRLPLLLSIVAMLACSKDSGVSLSLAPTDTNVTGTFKLTSSNGHVPPFLARLTNEEEWDLTADEIVIAADNTWAETTTYQVGNLSTGAVTTTKTESSGTYTIANGQINFVMTVGGTATFAGSVSGQTLSVIFNNGRLIYTR